jgi:hypothetical protein
VLVDEELWHPMAENLLETFSAIIFHTLLAWTWNTFFFNTLIWTCAVLCNVNWSTISEWLDEIKVDVNDLICNLQYCIEIWDSKIYSATRLRGAEITQI